VRLTQVIPANIINATIRHCYVSIIYIKVDNKEEVIAWSIQGGGKYSEMISLNIHRGALSRNDRSR
jgi:hypothetical protein